MKKTQKNSNIIYIFLLTALIFSNGCSREKGSYDNLEQEGKIESIIRKKYADFFKAVAQLDQSFETAADTDSDSTFLSTASELTDKVIGDILSFPSTLDSRIALDALSYAASDLSNSKNFREAMLYDFWQNGLLFPLFSIGDRLIQSSDINELAHLQLIKALQRGIGDAGTEELLLKSISLVGITPSPKIMEFCDADTLFLKKIHDMLLYTRSLQRTDPPMWMLSGAWFCAMGFNGPPSIFISIVPTLLDSIPYLIFRNYSMGNVYSTVFQDPSPKDRSLWDGWLTRVDSTMKSLDFDDSLIEKIRTSGLPVYDAHNYYDDYIIHTDADTTSLEFTISFFRNKIQDNAFQYTGMDSITVKMDSLQIVRHDSDILECTATRHVGASMQSGRFYPGRILEGTAYLVPLGIHTNDKIIAYQEKRMPKITINTTPVNR